MTAGEWIRGTAARYSVRHGHPLGRCEPCPGPHVVRVVPAAAPRRVLDARGAASVFGDVSPGQTPRSAVSRPPAYLVWSSRVRRLAGRTRTVHGGAFHGLLCRRPARLHVRTVARGCQLGAGAITVTNIRFSKGPGQMSTDAVTPLARYELEAGPLRVRGRLTLHTAGSEGTCTATVRYSNADSPAAGEQTIEFRVVDRQDLAELLRGLADQVLPMTEGAAHAMWCDLHQVDLEGLPSWAHDPHAAAWEPSLEGMECPHEGSGTTCRSAWRVGTLALGGKAAH